MELLIKVSSVIMSVTVFFFFFFFLIISTTSQRHKLSLTYGTLSIYVADIPDIYISGPFGKGLEETNRRYGHTSFGSLLSAEHDLWASNWEDVIAWFIEQMETSPLRTYDANSADMIFVPAMLNQLNSSQHYQFITEADQFLPYLTSKPTCLC